MKTKTWIFLFSLLFIACIFLSFILLRPGEDAGFAEILSAGMVVKTVDLRVEQSFPITAPNGGSNTITVRDGKIAVTEATCPDHYCMDRGYCGGGAQIVCLPNRLVIRFVGKQDVDISLG